MLNTSNHTIPSQLAVSTSLIKCDDTSTTIGVNSTYQYNKEKKDCIKNAIMKKLKSATLNNELGQDDSFCILDLKQLYHQHQKWKCSFPRIQPFYAIKCNPDPKIIQYLTSLGFGFECISAFEMKKILSYGVDPSKVIFNHTCKPTSHIQYAVDHDIRKMTFDTIDELHKLKTFYPNVELLLRILTDDSKSQWGTGNKYGANINYVDELLSTARNLNLNVVGISFHVGSGCLDIDIYQDALKNARFVFDRAKSFGFDFNLLNMGGGFIEVFDNPKKPSFDQIASVIQKTVDLMFPSNVQIIASPSRFYVTPTLTVCFQVVGRKILYNQPNKHNKTEHKKYMYYVNESLHASFASRLLYCESPVDLKVLMKNGICVYHQDLKEQTYSSMVWGHTCEPGDCLAEDIKLPLLNIGDWLYTENMGSYIFANSQFCGFQRPTTIYINSFCTD
ncbi:hypothetical protein INT45_014212 [Circinella minor]|uniref:ornithine decarboxylase n=1 Tax=Circinella minor TaxID=1195481 RepID=A0A8H7SE98_9FUNG|nr:hypothetical protein INT45_014212 [Circinella minor]